jgi:hypothetical protein
MNEPNRATLEQLARRLQECAESLAASLQHIKMAAGRQREYAARLNELSERIKMTLAEIQKAEASEAAESAPHAPAQPNPSAFNFLDLSQYIARKDKPAPPHFGPEMTYVDAMEFTDYSEFRRFQGLPPITDDDISLCDINDLLWRLLGQ